MTEINPEKVTTQAFVDAFGGSYKDAAKALRIARTTLYSWGPRPPTYAHMLSCIAACDAHGLRENLAEEIEKGTPMKRKGGQKSSSEYAKERAQASA